MLNPIVTVDDQAPETALLKHAVEHSLVFQGYSEQPYPLPDITVREVEVLRRAPKKAVQLVYMRLQDLHDLQLRLRQSFHEQMHPKRQLRYKFPQRVVFLLWALRPLPRNCAFIRFAFEKAFPASMAVQVWQQILVAFLDGFEDRLVEGALELVDGVRWVRVLVRLDGDSLFGALARLGH